MNLNCGGCESILGVGPDPVVPIPKIGTEYVGVLKPRSGGECGPGSIIKYL